MSFRGRAVFDTVTSVAGEVLGAQAVQSCRRRVGERGALERQHRGHPPTALGQRTVTHREDAAVNRVQEAASDPVTDTGSTQAKLHQLTQRDHPELPAGNGRNRRIDVRVPRSVVSSDAS